MSLYKSKEHTEKKSFISLKPEEETVSLNKIPAKLSLSSLSGFCHLSRTKQKVKKKSSLLPLGELWTREINKGK